MTDFKISIHYEEDIAVIEFSGSLYSQQVPELNRVLEMAYIKTNKIVLLISGLQYICSAALGTIIANFNKARVSGGNIILVGMNNNVKKFFDFVGVNKFMPTVDDIDSAINYFL